MSYKHPGKIKKVGVLAAEKEWLVSSCWNDLDRSQGEGWLLRKLIVSPYAMSLYPNSPIYGVTILAISR